MNSMKKRGFSFLSCTPFIFFVAFALYYLWPLLAHPFNWPSPGYRDAHEELSVILLERQSLVDFHQFPLWTPALWGGLELFSHPHSIALSPFFIAPVLAGEILGVKLYILLHFIFGFWGMFLLAGQLGCGRHSRYLPALIFMCSSILPLQVAEGTYHNLSLIWLPWVFLYYLKALSALGVADAYGKKAEPVRLPALSFRFCIVSALFCSVILASGALYPVAFFTFLFLFVFSFFVFLKNKEMRAFELFVWVVGITILVSAVKTLSFFSLASLRHFYAVPQYNDFLVFFNALFSRDQLLGGLRHAAWNVSPEVSFWDMYGAYLGAAVFILYLWGIKKIKEDHVPLILTSFFFLGLSVFDALFPTFKNLVSGQALFLPFYSLSRFKWIFVFTASLIVGRAVSSVENAPPVGTSAKKKWLILCILFAVTADFVSVSRPIFYEAFSSPPAALEKGAGFIQIRPAGRFPEVKLKIYPLIASGAGFCFDIMAYGEKLPHLCNAVSYGAPSYRGEIFLKGAEGNQAQLIDFSPHRVRIHVVAKKADLLALNQNYSPYWTVRGLPGGKVVVYNGLAAVAIPAGFSGTVTFVYSPFFFYNGLAISLVTLLLLIGCLRKVISRKILFWSVIVLLSAYGLTAAMVLCSTSGPASYRQAYLDFYQGFDEYRHNRFKEATPFLEKTSVSFPHSVFLREMLREAYAHQGNKEGVRQQCRFIRELLPAGKNSLENEGGYGRE